jgi:hypothetical protein
MAKETVLVLEPIIEIPASAQTWEEQQRIELREEFIRRNAEALAERRRILAENGLPDDTQDIDLAEIAKRCCS